MWTNISIGGWDYQASCQVLLLSLFSMDKDFEVAKWWTNPEAPLIKGSELWASPQNLYGIGLLMNKWQREKLQRNWKTSLWAHTQGPSISDDIWQMEKGREHTWSKLRDWGPTPQGRAEEQELWAWDDKEPGQSGMPWIRRDEKVYRGSPTTVYLSSLWGRRRGHSPEDLRRILLVV